ncbi:protein-glutamate O-methyltransferase CheR [Roseobacter denitrificans]|uniref:Chemotaxis protein methyltransferase n=1 Tax=Roseobacter denitrificans (strain ATCC 33942 / OCh 114) TaxID=375451 RepID=Q164M0_ROSDO|nr:CheR family methyltransferase [Roseobacter denitrificans]ABG32573.1 chemotaxis protein methyltransferase [Roseobacter denitrificans OCh 114]AVL52020.1 protein-glutamate O-methyltransferase CheR [Roseobacter denitrificans]SFF83805.1 chemotaxis protein methyltransferase CheR [Roseobacter denitrificans OCh 114]
MVEKMESAGLDEASFKSIAELAYKESGLQLVAEKMSMIQSRLRHRLKAVGIDTFPSYAQFVCSESGVSERREMISALTTNVSHFFREQHHFDILQDKILPAKIDYLRQGGRFRVWSAGCSNGQEAYSIVMATLDRYPEIAELDFRVLATDIDQKVVDFASKGVYPQRLLSGVSPDRLKKYFTECKNDSEPSFQAKSSIKSRVTFKELNLLSDWPMKRQMDVIFCRNVIIYFDAVTQNSLWPRFKNQLKPDGYLFLGHSERISDPDLAGFANQGPTTYRHKKAHEELAREENKCL